MTDLLQNEISVSFKDDEFIFAIPTIHDDIRTGLRARTLRQAIVGAGEDYSEAGLDNWTVFQVKACAMFEVSLRKSSATWPWTAGAGGPVVNSANFPKEKAEDVTAIYAEFREKVGTFRDGGSPKEPDGAETVAGQSGTKDAAVRA